MAIPIFVHAKLRPLRQAKGLSQGEIAAELGVSRPTYMLIEQGAKEPTLTQLYTLSRLLGVDPGELCLNAPLAATRFTNYPKFKELIAALVLHGAQKGSLTKTKLALLAYLADFAWYQANSKAMTDATYRQSARGPVADDFLHALDDLYEGQNIRLEPSGTGMLVHAVEQLPTTRLNEQELSLIHDIGSKWRTRSTTALLEFVNQQTHLKGIKLGETIPYETILGQPKDKLY